MWRHSWPADIIANLVSSTNREGTITNYDLEISALVLHKAILIVAVTDNRLVAPHSGYDNTPSVSWIMEEFLTINPLVADLLRLHAHHLRQFSVNPSVFNHLGIKNCIADNAYQLFDLSDTSLLSHISL